MRLLLFVELYLSFFKRLRFKLTELGVDFYNSTDNRIVEHYGSAALLGTATTFWGVQPALLSALFLPSGLPSKANVGLLLSQG